MIEIWAVRVVAFVDVLLGGLLLASGYFLSGASGSGEFNDSLVPGGLCIALGLVVFAMDRYPWTRPAAVMTAIFQVVGVVGALGYMGVSAMFA